MISLLLTIYNFPASQVTLLYSPDYTWPNDEAVSQQGWATGLPEKTEYTSDYCTMYYRIIPT